MSVFSIASLVTLEIPGELKGIEKTLLRSAAIRAVTNVFVPCVLLILLMKDLKHSSELFDLEGYYLSCQSRIRRRQASEVSLKRP